MTVMNLAEAINAGMDDALASDDRVMLLGEDVGLNGGVFRVSDGLQTKHGEERVVDTPVAESGIVGTAFGLAVGGMRPIVEIQFMGFSYPAFDQIASHVVSHAQSVAASLHVPDGYPYAVRWWSRCS